MWLGLSPDGKMLFDASCGGHDLRKGRSKREEASMNRGEL